MLDMDLVGWIVVGLIAGALSGMLVPGRAARGCLANVLVGVIGGIVGGWIGRQLAFGDPQGFLGAVVVALIGAVLVRLVLEALSPRDRARG
ncbi:MAG TPA: GlsB/YeaQ/YmgE family stress response membrane protein [Candidatus Acidoferrales bacterium]|nr:GlsB/YeaQ/YmgE family stress response membrane protein [Candidatus Acidoferrales bacterium]